MIIQLVYNENQRIAHKSPKDLFPMGSLPNVIGLKEKKNQNKRATTKMTSTTNPYTNQSPLAMRSMLGKKKVFKFLFEIDK